MKKPLILMVIFALCGGGYYGYTQYTASKTLNADFFEVYGNVEIRELNIAFKVSGPIEEIYVTEGQMVEKGDPIARLNARNFEDEIRLAQADVAIQEATLNKYQAGFRSQEIEQAKSVVEERKTTAVNLKQTYDRLNSLYKSGAVAKQQLEDALARYNEANARQVAAEDQLNLLLEGTRNEDIAIALASVEAAKARLAKVETALNDTTVYAPQRGIVLTKVKEEGEIIQGSQTVVSLTLIDPVYIRAYIPQPYLNQISGNKSVTLKVDGRTEEYIGTIGFISPTAEFTPKSVETKEVRSDLVFRFRVIADDPDNVFRQGMPVTIKIQK